jgi:type II secretory pathway pseudopilin PulG
MRSNHPGESLCACSNRIEFAEVLICILVCAILISFAVPRLTRLPNDVRATEMVALSATLRTAARGAHDQYVDSGQNITKTTWRGRNVRLDHGYPDAGVDGIQSVVIDTSEFTISTDLTSVTYYKIGAQAAAECAVTYRISPGSAVAPSTAAVTRGC